MYYLGMPIGDIEQLDRKEIEWYHQRLVKQKRDEMEAAKKERNLLRELGDQRVGERKYGKV